VLYEIYKDRVFRTCFRILGDLPAAEDAVQEIFIRVFDKIERFNEQSSFSTWLYRLAVNHTLNIAKRERRHAENTLETLPLAEQPVNSENPPDQTLAKKELSNEIQASLSALPPEKRSILVLREIEGFSYQEIADILEVPMGTVMSRLARARDAFRQKWLETHPVAEWNKSSRAVVTTILNDFTVLI